MFWPLACTRQGWNLLRKGPQSLAGIWSVTMKTCLGEPLSGMLPDSRIIWDGSQWLLSISSATWRQSRHLQSIRIRKYKKTHKIRFTKLKWHFQEFCLRVFKKFVSGLVPNPVCTLYPTLIPALCIEEKHFENWFCNSMQLFLHFQTSCLKWHLKSVEEKPLENRRLADLLVPHHHQT